MFKKLIAKILGKPLYIAEVEILEEEFTAIKKSNEIFSLLKWLIHGLHEVNNSNLEKTLESNIKCKALGKIREFKLFLIQPNKIGFFCYNDPGSNETMYITNTMMYIPHNILDLAKKSNFKLPNQFI